MLGGLVSLIINIGICYWMSQQFFGLFNHSNFSVNTYDDLIDFKATGAVNIEESAFIPYLVFKDVKTMNPL
jgi:hypothetical protein